MKKAGPDIKIRISTVAAILSVAVMSILIQLVSSGLMPASLAIPASFVSGAFAVLASVYLDNKRD